MAIFTLYYFPHQFSYYVFSSMEEAFKGEAFKIKNFEKFHEHNKTRFICGNFFVERGDLKMNGEMLFKLLYRCL